jgi:N-ethylmaleimide reductase
LATPDLKLFTPIQLGPYHLRHRVVMAPLTRSRSTMPGNIPNDLMAEYYGHRATDGGFLITEATNISPSSRGWYGAPGIFTDEQAAGWKKIIAAVHAKGGLLFLQLWHCGRAAHSSVNDGIQPVAPSAIPLEALSSTATGWLPDSPPRALELHEIPLIVEDYRLAAERAKAAGFDGVELHGGNGYLPDQFLQDGTNKRTDAYGGSIENRCRFLLEVVEAIASVWGGSRTAVRIGPGGTFNGMSDSNSDALFGYLAQQLNRFDLAYLHIIEPRVKGNTVIHENQKPIAAMQLRKIFKGRILSAGGYEPDSAKDVVEAGDADLVAFGRHFLSNPDLPRRIQKGLPLNPYDRDTFYTFDPVGYDDYPFYEELVTA